MRIIPMKMLSDCTNRTFRRFFKTSW